MGAFRGAFHLLHPYCGCIFDTNEWVQYVICTHTPGANKGVQIGVHFSGRIGHALARGLGWGMTGCLLWIGHQVCMFTYRLPSPIPFWILIGFSSFSLLSLSYFLSSLLYVHLPPQNVHPPSTQIQKPRRKTVGWP